MTDYATTRAALALELQSLRERRDAAPQWQERANIQAVIEPLQSKYDAMVKARWERCYVPNSADGAVA